MKRGLKREYLELKDGRTLSYIVDRPKDCEDDTPFVFYFPGMFSKADDFIRNTPPRDCIGIYVDRPGYGESTKAKDPQTWSYGQFANDIEELADALDIRKFYVLGHSSGGPCALACGAHLPDRVAGIAVLSGDPEYAAPGAPKENSCLLCCVSCMMPSLLLLLSAGDCCGCCAGRLKGSRTDLLVERKPYDFQVESITPPALFVTGNRDIAIPPSYTQFTHERLDGSELLTLDGVDHMSIITGANLKKIVARLSAMTNLQED